MSTRCNIVIKDKTEQLFFYRHSDGYPECTGESLKQFVKGYTDQTMRRDVMQSAGWLIIQGHVEYSDNVPLCKPNGEDRFNGWKVGAYEPATGIQGDIEFLYELDLDKRTLRCWAHDGTRKIKQITKMKTEF